MFKARTIFAPLALAALVTLFATSAATADDSAWQVSKASGEVWITASGAQPVALTSEAVINPGNTVRTGQNGRVLLVRGTESILVTANSVVGIPVEKEKKEGMTTILQQAGTILLDVEKRNVEHFEVATPYLAAVVKGTQFRVSVNNRDSRVDVLRGQVEVSDYKTGQFALVHRDQVARVSAYGPSGLSLSGAGALSPIQQGTPRQPFVAPYVLPREASSAPAQQQVRVVSALGHVELPAFGSDGASGKDFGWVSGLAATVGGLFNPNGRKNRDDDLTLMLAAPIAVGAFVTLGAAVIRRRKQKKADDR